MKISLRKTLNDADRIKRKTLHLSIANEISTDAQAECKLPSRKQNEERQVNNHKSQLENSMGINILSHSLNPGSSLFKMIKKSILQKKQMKSLHLSSSISQVPNSPFKSRNTSNINKNSLTLTGSTDNFSSNAKTFFHSPYTLANKTKSFIEPNLTLNPKLVSHYSKSPMNIKTTKDKTNLIKSQEDQKANENMKKLNQFKSLLKELLKVDDENMRKNIFEEIQIVHKKLSEDSWRQKINEIDEKLNLIRKDNLDMKDYVQVKTAEFDNLHSILKSLKSEIEEIKKPKNGNHKEYLFNNFNNEKSSNQAPDICSINNEKAINIFITNKNDSMNKTISLNLLKAKSPLIIKNITKISQDKKTVSSNDETEEHSKGTPSKKAPSPKIINCEQNKKFVNSCIMKTDGNNKDYKKDIKDKKDCPSSKPNLKINNLMLNLELLPKNDFNDEFMQYADEFSPSWREACKKINLCK